MEPLILEDIKDYLKIPECEPGYLYRIKSRNLSLGVYIDPKQKLRMKWPTSGFVGIREKFQHRTLFTEHHWDIGPPYGTVKPIECLEACPFDAAQRMKKGDTQELFQWLEEMGKKYNQPKTPMLAAYAATFSEEEIEDMVKFAEANPDLPRPEGKDLPLADKAAILKRHAEKKEQL